MLLSSPVSADTEYTDKHRPAPVSSGPPHRADVTHRAAVMKVLKKIKARIGLSHKTGGHGPPAQPLEFHPVHGDNIMLSANNTIAARYSLQSAISDNCTQSFSFAPGLRASGYFLISLLLHTGVTVCHKLTMQWSHVSPVSRESTCDQ